jgi:hypothetical protein
MSKNAKDTTIYIAYEDFIQFDSARPEKNLLRAILMNAMSDLRKPGELSRKAREYFLSGEEEYIFSFTSVCTCLDIDPKRILMVTGLRGEAEARRRQREALEALHEA